MVTWWLGAGLKLYVMGHTAVRSRTGGLAGIGVVLELSPGSQGNSLFPMNQDLVPGQSHEAPFLSLTPYSVFIRPEKDM